MPFLSLQRRFARQARLTPDAVAVDSHDTCLTYRELDERANRLAHRLLRSGVGPGTSAAVLMGRSADLVVAILAVVKSGAAYVPLHEAHPPARLQHIVDGAGCTMLLADRAAAGRGLPAGPETILVDSGAEAADRPSSDPGAGGLPDQPVYVMHTSGSTGEPKGVVVPQRGVVSLALDSCWSTGRHSSVAMVAPHAFGVSGYELWVPLLRGGRLVVAPPGPLEIRALRSLAADRGATALHVTAGLFRVIAEDAPESFAGFREILTGGDTVAPGAVQRVLEANPGLTVRVMYGATELTAFVMQSELTAPYRAGGAVPMGRPMDGVQVHILDGGRAPVRPGEIGELHIGGDRLALGYAGRPDLTAERFAALPDPSGEPGDPVYRTGDLVRQRPDGAIEFVGRAGNQAKIRGHRVEPAEVEAALGDAPGVAHAAVVAHRTAPGETGLAAYLVPAVGAPDLDAVRAHAAAQLPEYMRPYHYTVIDALPLTPNGKLDRAALPAPAADPAPSAAPDDGVPDDGASPRQRELCTLFAEVLGVERVGLHDSFFDLNGQSLLALRLVNRIQQRFGTELVIADLFNAPTVAELDQRLRAPA